MTPLREIESLVEVVCDEHHRQSQIGPKLQQQVLQLHPHHRVERAERFVHQPHFRSSRQRARDGDALLHAAGKLIRIVVRIAAKPDQVEMFEAELFERLTRGAGLVLHAEYYVIEHGLPREDRFCVLLEHEHHFGARTIDGRAAEFRRSRRRFGQASHDMQQSRFATAGRADQSDEFALADRERDVREGGAAMGREALFKPIDRKIVCHSAVLGGRGAHRCEAFALANQILCHWKTDSQPSGTTRRGFAPLTCLPTIAAAIQRISRADRMSSACSILASKTFVL